MNTAEEINQALAVRQLRYFGWDNDQRDATGEDVTPVKDGFVIRTKGKTRIFIPFSRVIDYTYWFADVTSRKAIEGF